MEIIKKNLNMLENHPRSKLLKQILQSSLIRYLLKSKKIAWIDLYAKNFLVS